MGEDQDHTVHWDIDHRPRRPSFPWTDRWACTNIQTGPLKWGRSKLVRHFQENNYRNLKRIIAAQELLCNWYNRRQDASSRMGTYQKVPKFTICLCRFYFETSAWILTRDQSVPLVSMTLKYGIVNVSEDIFIYYQPSCKTGG